MPTAKTTLSLSALTYLGVRRRSRPQDALLVPIRINSVPRLKVWGILVEYNDFLEFAGWTSDISCGDFPYLVRSWLGMKGITTCFGECYQLVC